MKNNSKYLYIYLSLLAFSLIAIFFDEKFLKDASGIDTGDTAWMLGATSLVLFMTPGLAFFYGGMVNKKSIISTMIQSFAAMGVISILWVVVGFSLAFGDSLGGIIGNPFTYPLMRGVAGAPVDKFSATIPFALFALFQLKFAIITPALITGAFSERIKFSSYLIFISIFSLLIYCPLAHWTWHPDGFLRQLGVLDFAGGTVVHLTAGVAALVGAWWIGPRKIRVHNHQPTNVPYVLLGTGMLWFGWFGFNAGSALGANALAAQAFITTNTASAAAMLAWIFLEGDFRGKPSASGACIGAVVGLVAITPAAGFVGVSASMFIGFFASAVSFFAVRYKEKLKVDDALDVFACHGLGGITGMILTAVLAEDVGLIHGSTTVFGAHLVGLIVAIVFVAVGSWVTYQITNLICPMRVTETDELEGLDHSLHGEKYAGLKVLEEMREENPKNKGDLNLEVEILP